MERDTYLLYRDGLGRFLLQSTETGIIQGMLWAAMPGESARAFSYDYGSIWYPDQIVNLADFPELAEMPFFTIDGGGLNHQYFHDPQCQAILSIVGASAKLWGYYVCPHQFTLPPNNILWQYTFPNPDGSWTMPIFDLWVNDQGCCTSNRNGWILGFDHEGEMIQQYKLPTASRCLTEGWQEEAEGFLASCEDGQIYEITGKIPQPIYQLRSPNLYGYHCLILAMIKRDNLLFIADLYGQLFCINENLECQWQNHHPQQWLSYFLGTDHQYLYQGYYQGLMIYEKTTGKLILEKSTPAPVLCGLILEQDMLIGCSDRQIYKISKSISKLEILPIFDCTGIPYAIALNPENQDLFISDSDGKVYQLNLQGNLQIVINLQKGAALTMKIWQNKLYLGTSQGEIICLNVANSDDNSKVKTAGLTTQVVPVKTTATPAPQSVSLSSQTGVILICIKQGKQLKIRPLSAGYHQDWNVAFPHHLREEGARYQVTGLQESKQGGFYRIFGNIKRL